MLKKQIQQRINNINESLNQLKKRALYYLSKREYTRLELSNKLSAYANKLEIDDNNLDNLLDDLEKNNWLSDQRFLEQFIHEKKKKFGPKKIAYELQIRGIDTSIIEKSLIKLKEEGYSLIKKIWEKKFNTVPKTKEDKLKQIRFLQSRGFDLSLIHQIISGKEKN